MDFNLIYSYIDDFELIRRKNDIRIVSISARTRRKNKSPRLTIAFLELYIIESNWSFKAVALASLVILKAIFMRESTEKNWKLETWIMKLNKY